MHVCFTDRKRESAIWLLMDQIAKRLSAEGNRVSYVRFDDDYSPGLLAVPGGVEVLDIKVPAKRFPWDIWRQELAFSIGFKSFLERARPDIVHSNFCLPGNVARRVAAQTGVAGVVTTYHELFGSLNAYLKWATRRTENHSDRLVYISRTVARSYGAEEELNETPQHQLIYNGLDIDRIESLVDNAAPVLPQQIVAIGRLVPEKGHALLLNAMQKLICEFPGSAVVITGQRSPTDEFAEPGHENWASPITLSFAAGFRGPMRSEKSAQSQSVVVPSRSVQEGFGLALAEAMLSRRPVVASDIEVFQEIASESEVTYFSENDATDLAVVLGAILRNPSSINIQPGEASARIKENFSSGTMVKAYLEVYRGLMSGASQSVESRRQ